MAVVISIMATPTGLKRYYVADTAAELPTTSPAADGDIGYAKDTDSIYSFDGAAWAQPTASAAWGSITGTLSDQTDLQTALDGKQAAATGTPDGTKYLRDDNSWQPVTGGSGLTQPQTMARISVGF